jgi:hypothetical protein
MQAKKRMPDHIAQNPSNIGMRSKYALRLYGWAKKNSAAGAKRITLEYVRKLFGLETLKDAAGNVIREAPLLIWANFRQRALDVATAEINRKTEVARRNRIVGKLGNRVNVLNFAIVTQEIPKAGRATSKK